MSNGTLRRLPARVYAELHTTPTDDVLAAHADGSGGVRDSGVLGRVLGRRFCRDYSARRDHVAEVLLAPWEGAWPPDVDELVWPFPPDWADTPSFWNDMDEDARTEMERAEQAPIATILEVLVPRLPPEAVVLEVACSHGACLAGLAAQRPDCRLLGRDLSPTMVDASRARLPNADIQTADARQLGDLQADAVLSRGFSHTVMLRPDAVAALAEAARVLRPGGWLVLCSATPPLLRRDDLTPFGRVTHTTVVDDQGGLKPLYVLERSGG